MANEPRVTIERANLGADPEKRYTDSGVPFVRITFAVTPYKRSGTVTTNGETQWWDATEWDETRMAAILADLHKGDRIRIEGILNVSAYAGTQGELRVNRRITYPHITRILTAPKPQNTAGRTPDTFGSAPQFGEDPFSGGI